MVSSQLITVENKSTILSPKRLFNLIWAVNYQVLFHYGRSHWVTKQHAPHGHVVFLPEGVKPPAGAWNLILMDTSDQQGALGYHDDENGTGIPYAEVFCKTSIADGVTPSSVASHEALEMLVDPDVNNVKTAFRKDTNQLYIVEVGDPVQGNDYDIGAPEGRKTGVIVSDFALPAWWRLESTGPYSFRNSVNQPWEIAPEGYMSVAPADDPNNWSQIYGHARGEKGLPAWASRLPRIHGKDNVNIAKV